MATIQDMLQKRAKLIADARALLDRADSEKRGLTQDENNAYDAMFAEAATLKDSADKRTKLEAVEKELDGGAEYRGTRQNPDDQAGEDATESSEFDQRAKHLSRPEYRKAFSSYLRNGANSLGGAEARALQADNSQLGGFLLPSTQFVNELIQALDNVVFVRKYARIMQIGSAEKVGVPTLESDIDDTEWTSELASGSDDTSLKFGKRELQPTQNAKRIKVSQKLLRKLPNVESFIAQRLAYKFGISSEKAFLLGDGASKPLGVFTASNDGVPTSRDVSTGNTTTSLTVDGLIAAKYALKAPYWANARWLFHRDALAQLAKMRDNTGGAGTGQYLWRESARAGEPDRLLNLPFDVSEYCPNTFMTGQYVGLLCDWSHYWIADALTLQIQRLTELYAEKSQVGFIGRMETDGQPVLAEAFVRVKLA